MRLFNNKLMASDGSVSIISTGGKTYDIKDKVAREKLNNIPTDVITDPEIQTKIEEIAASYISDTDVALDGIMSRSYIRITDLTDLTDADYEAAATEVFQQVIHGDGTQEMLNINELLNNFNSAEISDDEINALFT